MDELQKLSPLIALTPHNYESRNLIRLFLCPFFRFRKPEILHLGMIHRATEQAVCEFSIPCVLFALKTNHQLQIIVNGISKYCNIEYVDDNTIKINCDSDFYAVVYGL